jgi:hypothetical protein
LQEVLEAEMTEAFGAEKGERASGRQGHWSGYYGRTLITRVGKLSCGFRRTELYDVLPFAPRGAICRCRDTKRNNPWTYPGFVCVV